MVSVDPQTEKLEPHDIKVLFGRYPWNGHTAWFVPQIVSTIDMVLGIH